MAGVNGCNLFILSAIQLSKFQPKIILLKIIIKNRSNNRELLFPPTQGLEAAIAFCPKSFIQS